MPIQISLSYDALESKILRLYQQPEPFLEKKSADIKTEVNERLPGAPIGLDAIKKMKNDYEAFRLNLIKQHLYEFDPSKTAGFADSESCWFSKEVIQQLINQDGCEGVRIYYGVYGVEGETSIKDGYHNVILVGLRQSAEAKTLTREEIALQLADREKFADSYYTLFEDMLEDTDQVVIPIQPSVNQSSQPDDLSETSAFQAYDFGGLGPPLAAPQSALDS